MNKVSRQADYQQAILMLQNDKGFSDLSGRRTFIWWRPQDKSLGVFLFYPGNLVLYKTTDERLAEMKVKFEPLDNTSPIVQIIKGNVSGAKVQGKWDGGVAADGVIKMLESGQWVEDGYWTEAPPPDKPLLTDKDHEDKPASDTPTTPTTKRKRGAKAPEAKVEATGDAAAGKEATTTTKEVPDVAKKSKTKTAAKKGAAKPAKEKPKLGRISVTAKGKERPTNTAAGKRMADGLKYNAAHRNADAREVIDNTSFTLADLTFCVKSKFLELK